MHSMYLETAARIISPPLPLYKRAFSIAGTMSAKILSFSAQDQLQMGNNTREMHPAHMHPLICNSCGS